MSKTPHAAARTPTASKQVTFKQLSELAALIDSQKIDRDYMQDFLRRRLVLPGSGLTQRSEEDTAKQNEVLAEVEDLVRQHYPDSVNEVLEVLAPYCDPGFNFNFAPVDFKSLHRRAPEDLNNFTLPESQVHLSLFWLPVHEIRCSILGEGERKYTYKHRSELHWLVGDLLYKDVFTTLQHFDSGIMTGPAKIVNVIRKHIAARLEETSVARCGLLNYGEFKELVFSITFGLQKAIVFAARKDTERLGKVVEFLDYQRSNGHPVVHYHEGTVHVIAGPQPFKWGGAW